MNTILTVYGPTAFKRYLLPALNDADYSLLLSKELYRLEANLLLRLEVIDNEWRLVATDEYDLLLRDGRSALGRREHVALTDLLRRGFSSLRLVVGGKHVASVIIRMTDRCFAQYSYFDLRPGRDVTIGRSPDNAISYNSGGENLLSGHHAAIAYAGGGWRVEDRGGRNGTFVNGRRVGEPRPLVFGDCVDLFDVRIVFLGDRIAVNLLECGAHVAAGELRGTAMVAAPLAHPNRRPLERTFHRSPRQLSRLDDGAVTIDDAPPPKEDSRRTTILGAVVSGLAMALPMLVGCAFMVYASRVSGTTQGAFMLVGLVTSVTSATIGVVRTLTTINRARREAEEYERLRHQRYGEYLVEREHEIAARCQHNAEVLRGRHLPADVVSRYTADSPELWGKNATQPDFLLHRLGTGAVPSQLAVRIPQERFSMTDNDLASTPRQIQERYAYLRDVPICVDLRENRLVGIVGGHGMGGATDVARTLVAQVAATNSYTDVKLVVLYDARQAAEDDEWSYVRWLPHVWNETRTMRYVASSPEEASEVLFELNRVMRERVGGEAHPRADAPVPLPYYVLVLAAPQYLEGELMSQYVFRPRPECGLTTLWLSERYEDLPNECELVIQNDGRFRGMYRVTDNLDERVPIAFDSLPLARAQAQATALANVRVAEHQGEGGGDVPQSVTFFELYGIHRPEELDVLQNWRKSRTYESMRAVIGVRSGGAPCFLDIHEKYHGPHGLVAGTTGSGKSELLQTLVLSLAINFSPDDVAFFIIDYKGGGMASLLEGLPHLVGQVSNLSGSKVMRALVSIQSEKNRREAIFREYGVKDIRDYTRLVKSGEAALPVPHLIIVIDEFAEMKHDQPEFIDEIVSLSRVGRSLGIHLIMATQRPAGAVSEDIWANSRFKLCLRVQNRQDSTDMLHRPDAAFLTQTGRGYLQVGNDELFELFQSGYSGAPYVGDGVDDRVDVATMLSVDGMPSLVGSHTRIQRQRERKRAWIATLLECVQASGADFRTLSGATRDELEALTGPVYAQLAARRVDYPENDFNTKALVALLEEVGRDGFDVEAVMAADDAPGSKVRMPQQPERTELDALVAHLAEVARENGYDRDYSLLLPPLPANVGLSELSQEPSFDGAGWPRREAPSLAVDLGLYDDPYNQRQDALSYDALRDGDLAVYGGPQSGKSTLLQTLAYGLVTRHAPSEVSLYLVEYSARRFDCLDGMPHVGGIVRDNGDPDPADKLFLLLSRELEARKRALGDQSFAQYVELHGVGSLPAVVLVVDGYGAFSQRTDGRYAQAMRTLAKEGLGYGMFVALSAGGVGSAEVPAGLADSFRTVVCLELPNRYDYGAYLRRSHVRMTPEAGVAGRGVALVGDRPLEVQAALPLAGAGERDTSLHIRRLAAAMRATWHGPGARPIPSIPERPTWADLSGLESVRDMLSQGDLLPLGYDVATAEPYGIDLRDTYCYSLTGAKRKGKTNALRVLALAAAGEGARVVLVDYAGESARFAQEAGIEHVANEEEFSQFLKALMPEIVERNQAKARLVSSGAAEGEVYRRMREFRRVCVLIDDFPQFVERAYQPTVKLSNTFDSFLGTVLDRCTLHNIYWFAAIDRADVGSASGREIYRLFVRDHRGAHFGGRTYSTAVPGFGFDRHNRRTVDDPRPVGRAMLAGDDDTDVLEVVVPLAEGGAP